MKETAASKGVGYAIVGFPGAGKSEAGRILANLVDGINIETGDIVRRGAEEHFEMPISELSSNAIGDYSTMRRRRDGGDYVAQDVITDLDSNPDFPGSTAIITGMRDTESPDLFRDFFDEFWIVWIHTEFDERLQRLQKRDRQDEKEYTKEDLAERDGRENMWGTSDLVFMADYRIHNSGSIVDLHDILERDLQLQTNYETMSV